MYSCEQSVLYIQPFVYAIFFFNVIIILYVKNIRAYKSGGEIFGTRDTE